MIRTVLHLRTFANWHLQPPTPTKPTAPSQTARSTWSKRRIFAETFEALKCWDASLKVIPTVATSGCVKVQRGTWENSTNTCKKVKGYYWWDGFKWKKLILGIKMQHTWVASWKLWGHFWWTKIWKTQKYWRRYCSFFPLFTLQDLSIPGVGFSDLLRLSQLTTTSNGYPRERIHIPPGEVRKIILKSTFKRGYVSSQEGISATSNG